MFFSFCVRCRRARATLTRRRLCGCAVCALVVVAGGAAQGLLCRYYRSMRVATSTTRFHSFGGGCCCCFIPGNGRNLCDIYDVWKSCKVHKNEEKLNFSSAVVVFFVSVSSSAALRCYRNVSGHWLHFSSILFALCFCGIASSSPSASAVSARVNVTLACDRVLDDSNTCTSQWIYK